MITFNQPPNPIILNEKDHALFSALKMVAEEPSIKSHFNEFFNFFSGSEIDREYWRKRVVEIARNNFFSAWGAETTMKASLVFFRELAERSISDEKGRFNFHKQALVNLFVIYFESVVTLNEEIELLHIFTETLELCKRELHQALANLIRKKYGDDLEKIVAWFKQDGIPKDYLPALFRLIKRDQSLGSFYAEWLRASEFMTEDNIVSVFNCSSSEAYLASLFHNIFEDPKLLIDIGEEEVEKVFERELMAMHYFTRMASSFKNELQIYAFYLFCFISLQANLATLKNRQKKLDELNLFLNDCTLEAAMLQRGIRFLGDQYFRSGHIEGALISDIQFLSLFDLLSQNASAASMKTHIEILCSLEPFAFTPEQKQQLLRLMHEKWMDRSSLRLAAADDFLRLFIGTNPLFRGWESEQQFLCWLSKICFKMSRKFDGPYLKCFIDHVAEVAFREQSKRILKQVKKHLLTSLIQFEASIDRCLQNEEDLRVSMLKKGLIAKCRNMIEESIARHISCLTANLNSSIRVDQ